MKMSSILVLVLLACVWTTIAGQEVEKEPAKLELKIAEDRDHVLFVGQFGKDNNSFICKLRLDDFSVEKMSRLPKASRTIRFVDIEKRVYVIDESEGLGPGLLVGYSFDGKTLWNRQWCDCTESVSINPNSRTAYFHGHNACYRFSMITGKRTGSCEAFDLATEIESARNERVFLFQRCGKTFCSRQDSLKSGVKLTDDQLVGQAIATANRIFVCGAKHFFCFNSKTQQLLWRSDQFRHTTYIREIRKNKMTGLRHTIDWSNFEIEKIELICFDADTGQITQTTSVDMNESFEYLSNNLALIDGNQICEIPSMKLLKKFGK